MSAIIVNGATPFGAMSNAAVAKLLDAVDDIHRLKQAVALAKSGVTPEGAAMETGSNFGVVPNGTPGEQGAAYAYALDILDQNLQTFYAANQGYISALDNGG